LPQHFCVTLSAAREGTNWKLYNEGKAQGARLRGSYPTRLNMTPKFNMFFQFVEAVVPRN
jgi:hypothetical protein